MKLTDVPKFDPALFTKEERAELQALTDRCVAAIDAGTLEKTGAELDEARADHRAKTRELAARSYSLNALHKRLIRFVPRPLAHEEAE